MQIGKKLPAMGPTGPNPIHAKIVGTKPITPRPPTTPATRINPGQPKEPLPTNLMYLRATRAMIVFAGRLKVEGKEWRRRGLKEGGEGRRVNGANDSVPSFPLPDPATVQRPSFRIDLRDTITYHGGRIWYLGCGMTDDLGNDCAYWT